MLKKIGYVFILVAALSVACWPGVSFAEDPVFDGELEVGGDSGQQITLPPTADLVSQDTLEKASVGKTLPIGWEDIADYEKQIAKTDPVEAFNIDNLWAARINKVMMLVEEKYSITPNLDSVLQALVIPLQRPSGNGDYEVTDSRVPYLDRNFQRTSSATPSLIEASLLAGSGVLSLSGSPAPAPASGPSPLPAASGVMADVDTEETPDATPSDTSPGSPPDDGSGSPPAPPAP